MPSRRNHLKRVAWGFVGFVFALIIGCYLYLTWMDATVVERDLKNYAGITSYTVLAKEVRRDGWYAKVGIQESDGDRLLREFPFKSGFGRGVVGPRIFEAPFGDCATCSYYLDTKDRGAYGYVLYVLSEGRQQLFIYQEFTD